MTVSASATSILSLWSRNRPKIGLLGGSFNPAHEGHYHISMQAMRQLQLDALWWLPSPQNPLKSSQGMADYAQRVASAQPFLARDQRLRLCEIEQQQGLRYTADTLHYLKLQHPQAAFVWLMGSDNLRHFHRWHRWRQILQTVPIGVMDRSPHSHAALHSPVALAYARHRVQARQLVADAEASLPRWSYVFIPRHPESATRLRNQFGKNAFLR